MLPCNLSFLRNLECVPHPEVLRPFPPAGYGDIHAVNVREMIFVMIYVSFDMILGAYLIGNMTALIVKGSRTERFRDKMKEVIRYMNRNKLGKEIREQIKGHLRLQYESSYTEASVLQDIPISIRAKVTSYILDLFLSFCDTVLTSEALMLMLRKYLYLYMEYQLCSSL